MAAESAQTVVAVMTDHILPLAPGLRDQLQSCIEVLDIDCGSGKAACALADAFPNSRFTCYDLSDDAIAAAQAEADQLSLTDIRFETRDSTQINEPDCCDVVTAFDVIHDQKAPATVLDQVYRAIKPVDNLSRHVPRHFEQTGFSCPLGRNSSIVYNWAVPTRHAERERMSWVWGCGGSADPHCDDSSSAP
jgi:trans-aconitate methyltransferase